MERLGLEVARHPDQFLQHRASLTHFLSGRSHALVGGRETPVHCPSYKLDLAPQNLRLFLLLSECPEQWNITSLLSFSHLPATVNRMKRSRIKKPPV